MYIKWMYVYMKVGLYVCVYVTNGYTILWCMCVCVYI